MAGEEKIRYEIDPHNRLIVERAKKESSVKRFRQVLDGRFAIDNKNDIVYHIKKSKDIDVPQQIKFSGKFSLDRNHNLTFTLDKWNNQIEGNRLTIRSEILDVKNNELSFTVVTKNNSSKEQIYILKLGGAWQADTGNRLNFCVEKENGFPDKLVFSGGWDINKHHQLIYSYEKVVLKTKEKELKVLTFKGYWDILDKYRISYTLSNEYGSRFDFQVTACNFF